jgi:predicted anti-sigma-YlaC factor YlaD
MELHLDRCSACHAFDRDVAALTKSVRHAPLERPRNPIVVSARRRVSFARVNSGVAAAVAVVSIGVAVQFARSEPEQSPAARAYLGTSVHVATDDELAREVRQILAAGRAYDHDSPGDGSAVPI